MPVINTFQLYRPLLQYQSTASCCLDDDDDDDDDDVH